MLTAATAAESKPAGSGKYWHTTRLCSNGPVPAGPSHSESGWTGRITGRIVPWSAQIPYITEQNARANGD